MEMIHSNVLLAQNIFTTQAMTRPMRAIVRKAPIFERSCLVK